MDERYWGLIASPFQGRHDLSWFVETPAHEEALARLSFVVEQRRPLGLLRGSEGTGKSLVLQAARRDARRLGREVAFVDLFGLDSHEFLWQLANSLKLSSHEQRSRWWLWQTIQDFVQSLRMARWPLVLITDHLDRADSECWSLLERLLHHSHAETGLTILAAVQEDFESADATRLARFSDFRIELPCLNRHETALLIGQLLGKAGCRREILDAHALRTLCDLSRGQPREMLRLCDLALTAGAHQGARTIDSSLLQAVAEELPVESRPQYSLSRVLAGVL